jgi:hypothetical protein
MSVTRSSIVFLVCASLVWLMGCSEDQGAPVPNIDPETTISSSIPVEGGSTAHHVQIFWSGGDVDGRVVEWQYLVETYPRSVAEYAGVTQVVPEVDDPRWISNGTRSNITLVLAADTLRADPRGDIGDGLFTRWHTIWVRAIDNEGAADQTPDSRTFEAFTRAPEMTVQSPVVIGQLPILPISFVMNWYGADDIGMTGNYQDPLEVRWTLQAVQLDGNNVPVGFPDILFDLADSEWSDWFAWDAPDSTGREAVFLDQLPQAAVDTPFLFALQGRDDGGAVTPQYDLDTPQKNNVGVFVLSNSVPLGPTLTVRASIDTLQVGEWDFVGSSATTQDVMVMGGAVSVRWDVMVTSHYGANPGEYRYGWNIANPDDDNLWSEWGSVRVSPPQTIVQPVEEIRIQARDHIGQVTTAIIRFQKI